MKMREYQKLAQVTDQNPGCDESGLVIPLLGMIGEAGSLLSEYKKKLRDGDSHVEFRQHLSEELGDLLWYIANLAQKWGLDLEDIARANIDKVNDRWPGGKRSVAYTLFDEGNEPTEQLPRRFEAELEEHEENGVVRVTFRIDGKQVGNEIADNAWTDDGYRFHDVFHLTAVP
ncbi:MAG: hypothetical protein GKR94_16060 [Gammaproteobacteria bacterium]|nr:hypothetical protein [Gammaproteobacteria bacterium]